MGKDKNDKELTPAEKKDSLKELKEKSVINQLLYYEPFTYFLLFQKELIENYMTVPEIVKMVQEKTDKYHLIFNKEAVPNLVSRAIDTLSDLCMLDNKWIKKDGYTTKGYRNVA